MKTIIYVDGFNLYHRALKKTKHKWLDIRALCQAALPRNQDILQINYYTARVSGKIDPEAAKDQNSYLKALSTTPTLKIHYGSFQVTEKYMYLCQPIDFQPSCLTEPDPMPRFARVVKIEEKGSDVNLGAHLVRDAFAGAFQHAAVITNDTACGSQYASLRRRRSYPSRSCRPSANLRKACGTLQRMSATSTDTWPKPSFRTGS